jgi:hypothetical protein
VTTFYLGTHRPHWLRLVDVPLVVSRRTLSGVRSLPRALGRWGLDSGGFTELDSRGAWEMATTEWATLAARFADEIGNLDWVAPQDWMCEPRIRERTGLTVAEHQRRTVDNYLELRALDDSLPWLPVIQGWEPGDYLRCIDLYSAAGVDLAAQPLVGLGTVCRRQHTAEIGGLVSELVGAGLRLHGFGVKISGLRDYGWALESSDSMAWSYDGRRTGNRCGGSHRSCANCLYFALAWRQRVLALLECQQPSLWAVA